MQQVMICTDIAARGLDIPAVCTRKRDLHPSKETQIIKRDPDQPKETHKSIKRNLYQPKETYIYPERPILIQRDLCFNQKRPTRQSK